VSKEVKTFCDKNFEEMTEARLVALYDAVKAYRGLEMPLNEFEACYGKIREKVLMDAPPHSTVVISLWGLQFKFPEDFLAKDLLYSLTTGLRTHSELEKYQGLSHMEAQANSKIIASLIRERDHACRGCILCCFNLIEAYLTGIAWDFARNSESFSRLSNRDQARLTDIGNATLRDKIIRYPTIVTGKVLWNENDNPVKAFLTIFKPFRDSLVHPSPFSAPDKFGGYDKLSKFYRVDIGVMMWAVRFTCELISSIHRHMKGANEKYPKWLSDLVKELENYEFLGEPEFN
jgi:hypothetical protein